MQDLLPISTNFSRHVIYYCKSSVIKSLHFFWMHRTYLKSVNTNEVFCNKFDIMEGWYMNEIMCCIFYYIVFLFFFNELTLIILLTNDTTKCSEWKILKSFFKQTKSNEKTTNDALIYTLY